MKTIKIDISKLRTPEKNVRIHTEKQIQEFIRSIKMFGQIRPVVIDENNTILAGNGLVEALKAMNIKQADALVMDNLTKNQKKKLMIADNKIFSLGIENLDTLNAFLEELGQDLDIPGFDEEILKTMVADGEEVTEKIAEYGTLDEEEISAIKDRQEKEKETAVNEPEKPINYAESSETASTNEEYETTEQEVADIRKFVICTKCGEKIWL